MSSSGASANRTGATTTMRLIVEDGYNRGAEIVLGEPTVVLGRGADCAVQLLDESVSRHHAELTRGDDGVSVRDLGSRNGTRVNGVPVETAAVEAGDRIALGDVRLLLLPAPVTPGEDEPSQSIAARPTAGVDLSETVPVANAGTIRGGHPGPQPGEILGESTAMKALLTRIGRAAPTPATILIQGESGTGKELVARAIHGLSPRRRGPFVVVNCAALPTELVESELFGHEKGAFTGALARKAGLVEAAHHGTLFLDELGELAPPAQAKLLRFLESGEVQRLGATRPMVIDARLVAATHRNLERLVTEGSFRADLLHRVRVVELFVPPLRDRGDDIPLLAEAFLRQLAGERRRFSRAALSAIKTYRWPGNVRELRNAVEAAVILAKEDRIDVTDLPPRVVGGDAGGGGDALRGGTAGDDGPLSLEDAERRAIIAALRFCDGHRTRTAKVLGIDRKTLYSKLKALGIDE